MGKPSLTTKFFVGLIFVVSGVGGFALSLYSHHQHTLSAIHHPDAFIKQLAGDPHAGKKIFKEFCATCHAKDAALNTAAPRIGDKKSWQALNRIGMPTLLAMTQSGAPPMPPRGGCFECSDQQLQATIQYMLDVSE